MLFAECDCRVSLACDNGSLTAKLMHPKAYRSCHCLAERMLGCIRITAGLRAKPPRLVREAEQPKDHAGRPPFKNSPALLLPDQKTRGPSFFSPCQRAVYAR